MFSKKGKRRQTAGYAQGASLIAGPLVLWRTRTATFTGNLESEQPAKIYLQASGRAA